MDLDQLKSKGKELGCDFVSTMTYRGKSYALFNDSETGSSFTVPLDGSELIGQKVHDVRRRFCCA